MVESEVLRDFAPQPVLLQPTTETVDLTGKSTLNFSWSPHEGDVMKRVYYDFRLYKGYDLVQSNLIYKKEVLPQAFSVDISSDTFQAGKVYTWSVRQVYDDLSKSYRSSASFKVIKN